MQNRVRTVSKKQFASNRVLATGYHHDPILITFQSSLIEKMTPKLSQESLKASSHLEPWALFPDKQLSAKLSRLPDCHITMGRQFGDGLTAPEPAVGSPMQSQESPAAAEQQNSNSQSQKAEKPLLTDSRAIVERVTGRQKQSSSNRRREHSPLRVRQSKHSQQVVVLRLMAIDGLNS